MKIDKGGFEAARGWDETVESWGLGALGFRAGDEPVVAGGVVRLLEPGARESMWEVGTLQVDVDDTGHVRETRNPHEGEDKVPPPALTLQYKLRVSAKRRTK